MRSVAIALIDCDLYDLLAMLCCSWKTRSENNTILLFDDWNCFDGDENKGQRRAVREFLDRSHGWWFDDWFSYGDYGP